MDDREYWLTEREMDRAEEYRRDAILSRSRFHVFNCGERVCGSPDCKSCYPGTKGCCEVCHEMPCECGREDDDETT